MRSWDQKISAIASSLSVTRYPVHTDTQVPHCDDCLENTSEPREMGACRGGIRQFENVNSPQTRHKFNQKLWTQLARYWRCAAAGAARRRMARSGARDQSIRLPSLSK
ncbi:MAG: hypothetical protein AAFR52_03300, partial [Pseudomonadota bacterium]